MKAYAHHPTEYDSFDDFCLVPSSADEPPATARLKKENTALKSKLEAMEKQMASVRRQITLRNEQDQHLRDNIALARKEVRMLTKCPGARRTSNSDGLGTTRDGSIDFLRAICTLNDEPSGYGTTSSSTTSIRDRPRP